MVPALVMQQPVLSGCSGFLPRCPFLLASRQLKLCMLYREQQAKERRQGRLAAIEENPLDPLGSCCKAGLP